MQLAQNIPTLDFQSEAVEQGLPFAEGLANPERGFGTFLGGLLSAILVIAVLMVLLYLLWGAIEWISSSGDKGKTEKARDKMTQAVIGLIVLAATLAIMGLLQSFLGVEVLNFIGSKQEKPAIQNPNQGGLGTRGTGNKTLE